MNKQFMLVNGKVIVSTEEGMKGPITYTDSLEDILAFENELEYLNKCLAEDEEFLKKQTEERISRRKSALKTTGIVGGAAVVASGVCYLGCKAIPGLADQVVVDQLITTICGVGVMFGPFLGWMEVKTGPTKNILSCYEERIAYEKEMIEIIGTELEELRTNQATKNIGKYEEMTPYSVRDKGSIEYLEDSIRLRDLFGYNRDKIMKLYYEEKLLFVLRDKKYDENAIMDFLLYLDSLSRKNHEEEVSKLTKK